MQRRSFVAGLAAAGLLPAAPSFAQADPLPSWNDGPVKQAILDFVPRATTAGGADFVPVPERIATFDNDGTLWTEQPNYFQVLFAIDRVKALAVAASRMEDARALQVRCSRTIATRSPPWARRACSRSWRRRMPASPPRNSGRSCSIGSPRRAIRASSDPIPTSSTSRCWSCWPSCAPTSSRPSSSRAAASNSCGPGPSASTASRRSRWWAPRASPNT